jgi:serine-type D-Ala-D-Ala carboxypeptidase/endopeptidase (penicillin-binding protein 4)
MRILLLWALVSLCPLAFAQPNHHLPPAVSQALADAHIPISAVGIVVQEAGSAGPRLSVNADQAMNPASVIKLVTTFTALELLGPAYTWRTGFWSQAPIDDGVLRGDLYLRGSADPKLTFEQFWLLLRQLRARGVHRIDGDLVLDRTLIATGDYDPAAFDEKPLRPYNVGPDALLLNFKAIRLTLVPAADRVQVLPQPQPANLDIVDDIRLDNNGCGDWKKRLHAELGHHGQRWRLTLTGRYSANCGENDWNLSVMPHADYVRGVFEQLWHELGGSWHGNLRNAAVPVDAREITSIESPPLADVIRDINKYSNNVMARQLFLTVGAETGQRPVTVEDADALVRAWLDTHGLHMPELVFDNGAGLSRRDRISAGGLARLLAYAWKSPVMPEFVASLPLAAVDGTMKKRLNGDGVAGQAHIKTGTLDGVKSIAGYVLDRDGHHQIIVFLVNHANAGAAQTAQDALLDWVYHGDR